MRNQFFYTRKGEDEKTFKDSFNVDKVIRSITMPDGSTLVLLDDIHERTTESPIIDHKKNKITGTARKRDVYQTEISLDPADAERFDNLTSVDDAKFRV